MKDGGQLVAQPVLVARNIRKEYFRKGRDAARYFDAVPLCEFSVDGGTLMVLKGRSGSGKTTLLNMIGGLLEPTEGTVEFKGRDLYQLGDAELSRIRNEHFGIIPQGPSALYSLSVVNNVLIAQTMYRAQAPAQDEALDLLEKLGIGHLADSMPSELSGGELRRMAIARALINKPDVILADEPTGDLDDENTQVVMEVLREKADQGAAVVMATHEQIVESYADEVKQMQSL